MDGLNEYPELHLLGLYKTFGFDPGPDAYTMDRLGEALLAAEEELTCESATISRALRREIDGMRGQLTEGGSVYANRERIEGLRNTAKLLRSGTKQPCGLPPAGLEYVRKLAHYAARECDKCGGLHRDIFNFMDAFAKALDALAGFAAANRVTTVPEDTAVGSSLMEEGLALCQTVLAEARKRSMRVVCAACDSGGNLAALLREDGAYIASIDLAINKAWTSVSLQMPTEALETLAAPGGALYGLQNSNGGRIIIFAGGIPLYQKGLLVGGFGVSGGTAAEDKALAHFAGQAWTRQNTGKEG